MSDHSLADVIVGILSIISFSGVIAFFVSYSAFFRFGKTAGGRAVFLLTGALLLTALSSLLFVLFGPDYWGRDILRIFSWTWMALSSVFLPIALWMSWARHKGTQSMVVEPRSTKKTQ